MSDAIDQSVIDALTPQGGSGPVQQQQPIDQSVIDALNPSTPGPAEQQAPQQSLYQEINNDRPGFIRGVAEDAANWATGAASVPVAGIRAVLDLAHGASVDQAVHDIQSTEQASQFFTPNDIGKRIAEIPGEISNAVESEGNKILPGAGTVITHPGKALGNAAADIATKAGLPPEAAGALGAVGATIPTAAGLLLGRAGIPGSAEEESAAMGEGGRIASESGSSDMVGGGAAVANSNPYRPFEGQDTSRGPYPIVTKLPDTSPQAQATRSAVLQQVLENPERVRPGVLTGDVNTLRDEYEQARASNPTLAGQLLKQKMNEEQASISNYATKQLDATGENPHFVDDYQRGDFHNSVMFGPDGIKGLMDTQRKSIYDQAMQAAGNVPIRTDALDALRLNPQFSAELQLAGQKDFLAGMSNLIDMAKTQGFEGAPGGSVAAMEKLRQAVNRQWSPQNRHFVGQVVNAIDDDVASAGGPGLLAQGRQIHQAEKTIFGSPGIKRLFGDVDPNGVQTATPFEKIPSTLNNMPYDQWRHVFDTYDAVSKGRIPGTNIEVPQELQAAAQQAKNEMAGSLVREVRDAGAKNPGVWTANMANKMMNARSKKLSLALDPELQQNMHTLNLAGQIMPSQFAYEGMAQQWRRLGGLGLNEPTASRIGGAIGSKIPIPGARWAGEKIGEKIGGALTMHQQVKEARELDAKMEAAAKYGRGK